VFTKTFEEIKEVAKNPYGQYVPFPECEAPLRQKVLSIKRPLMASVPLDQNKNKSPICINNMMSAKPIKGQRHATAMRIMSHLIHYANIPENFVSELIKTWWKKTEPDTDIDEWADRTTESIAKNYRYGCKDTLLAANCSEKCIFYKDKSYMTKLLNIKEIFTEYLKDIKEGKYIDLEEVFPDLIEDEFIVLNKDLVGIVGAPGCGKSTLALDIIMRLLHQNEEAHAAILNLDNGHELSIRRMVQWMTRKGKEEIIRPTRAMKTTLNKTLDFIDDRVEMFDNPNINDVDSMLHEWDKHFKKKPTVLVIDHVGNLTTSASVGGYEKMRYIGDYVKSIAKKHGILVLAIGHIRKGDSRDNIITPESARDANLGPASDVLIGLTYRDPKSQTSDVEVKTKKILIMSSPKARDNNQFRFLVEYDSVTSTFTKVAEGTGEVPMRFKSGHV